MSAENSGLETVDAPVRVLASEDIDRAEHQWRARLEGDVGDSEREPAPLGQGGFGRVDDHSGAYAYAVNVFCPPARNGAPTPRVVVSYNSMNSNGPSLIGAGWRLELGRIQRVARQGELVNFRNDQGAAASNDHFLMELSGQSYTLVKVLGEPHRFRFKIEQSYAEAERVLSDRPDPVSGDMEIDHWVVYLADGTRYVFGVPGKAGEEEAGGELRNKVWNITAVENAYGHCIRYEYEACKHDNNPAWKEMAYSYPKHIKLGMTPEGQWWDGLIEFVYTAEDLPSQQEGYYNLGIHYTGRETAMSDGYTCIIRRRLKEIRTLCRDENGGFMPSRSIRISAESLNNRICVTQIQEVGYKDGHGDTTAALPPHRFRYIAQGSAHPALMVQATTPLGKAEAIEYDLATRLDQGTPQAVEGVYLVKTWTETSDNETWTRDYRYWDGRQYTPFMEYRGHRRVDILDKEKNQRFETVFEQNGVHNGLVRLQRVYDADGKKMSETENTWMALDYAGGRYMPFIQKTVSRRLAEDGRTVLSATVKEIPRTRQKDHPWGYEIDEFGNILLQIETIYQGDVDRGTVIFQRKHLVRYRNQTAGARRFIGLPLETRRYTRRTADEAWTPAEWIENRYNDQGQPIETKTHLDRLEENAIYKTGHEYDPTTGKITRNYRHDGDIRHKVEEIVYYTEGPYRYLPHRRYNALEQCEESLRYDLALCQPVEMTRMDGMLYRSAYDGMGRVTEEIYAGRPETAADKGGTDSVRYVYTVTPEERSVETVHLHTGARQKDFFDPLSRKVRTLRTGYHDRWVELEATRFDYRTRKPTRVAEPHFADEDAPGYRVIEYNDPRWRVSSERFPNGKILENVYEGLKETKLEHVYWTNPETGSEERVHTRVVEEVTRDGADRVISRAEGWPGHPNRHEIYYYYDSAGHLCRVTDNLGDTLQLLEYGGRMDEKPVRVREISRGECDFVYDGLGRLHTVRYAFKSGLDRKTVLACDALDRVVQQTDTDMQNGAERVTKTRYDTAANGIGMIGAKEIAERSPLGTFIKREQYQYDGFGLPAAATEEWELNIPEFGIDRSFTARTDYEHNGAKGGRLERVSYRPGGNLAGGSTEYAYDDPSGALTEVRFQGKAVWTADLHAFNARGQVGEFLLGNGVRTIDAYDPSTGRLTRYDLSRRGDPMLECRLVYDSAGNVRQVLKRLYLEGPNPAVHTSAFAYDNKNELTEATEAGRRMLFAYKTNGSRIHLQADDQVTRYAYNGASPHQLTDLTGHRRRHLSYDAAGNLIEDTNIETGFVRRLEWNASNRLQRIRHLDPGKKVIRSLCYGYGGDDGLAFRHDSRDQRLTIYVDEGFDVEWDLRSNRMWTRMHLLRCGRRFATVEMAAGEPDSMTYYHRDHLQSVVMVTDLQGQVVWTGSYEPFGRIREETGKGRPDVLFTGQRADRTDAGGFVHYDCKARVYDPDLGTFLSPDMVEDTQNIAFGLNRYVYARNNPTSYADPSGGQLTGFDAHKALVKKFEHEIHKQMMFDSIKSYQRYKEKTAEQFFGGLTVGFHSRRMDGFYPLRHGEVIIDKYVYSFTDSDGGSVDVESLAIKDTSKIAVMPKMTPYQKYEILKRAVELREMSVKYTNKDGRPADIQYSLAPGGQACNELALKTLSHGVKDIAVARLAPELYGVRTQVHPATGRHMYQLDYLAPTTAPKAEEFLKAVGFEEVQGDLKAWAGKVSAADWEGRIQKLIK